MSNIKIIQKLQDATAFFSDLEDKRIEELLFTIRCSFDKEVKDLKGLNSYDQNKIIELINTKVNFNLVLDNLNQTIDELKEEGRA
jgi:exonuclease I